VHTDDRRFAGLTGEVDQIHHESMAVMADEFADVPFGEVAKAAGPGRRDLLRRAAAGGVMLTIGAMVAPIRNLLPAAWAELPPDDGELAQFAAGLELAAVAAYGAALDTDTLSLSVENVAKMFAGHHRQHADALNGALGEELAVTKPRSSILRSFAPKISAAQNEKAVLEMLYQVEEAAAATYLFAIGEVSDVRSAGTLATILPVESQHATVLATVLGKEPSEYLVEFLSTDQAAKPADFPA